MIISSYLFNVYFLLFIHNYNYNTWTLIGHGFYSMGDFIMGKIPFVVDVCPIYFIVCVFLIICHLLFDSTFTLDNGEIQ